MREQLYYLLQNDAVLTSLIGDRVFPQRVPTFKAQPYVSFIFIERNTGYDQDGYDKHNMVLVEINSAAPTLGGAVDVAEQVFKVLNIQNQKIGEAGNTEELCSTTLETEIDNFDLFDNSEDGVRIITQNYTISYLEA